MAYENSAYLDLSDIKRVDAFLQKALLDGKVVPAKAIPKDSLKAISDKYEKGTAEYEALINEAFVPVYQMKESLNLRIGSTDFLTVPGDLLYHVDENQYDIGYFEDLNVLFDSFNRDVQESFDTAYDSLNLSSILLEKPTFDENNSLIEYIVPENYLVAYTKALDFNGISYDVSEFKSTPIVKVKPEDQEKASFVIDKLRNTSQVQRDELIKAIDTIERTQLVKDEEAHKKNIAKVREVTVSKSADIKLQDLEDKAASERYYADRYSQANLDNLSLDQLKDYADDVEVNAKANLTDVTVEQEQEVEDSKFTFNDIINTPNRPILPSELDFGDNYDHERMRDDDVDGFSGE